MLTGQRWIDNHGLTMSLHIAIKLHYSTTPPQSINPQGLQGGEAESRSCDHKKLHKLLLHVTLHDMYVHMSVWVIKTQYETCLHGSQHMT